MRASRSSREQRRGTLDMIHHRLRNWGPALILIIHDVPFYWCNISHTWPKFGHSLVAILAEWGCALTLPPLPGREGAPQKGLEEGAEEVLLRQAPDERGYGYCGLDSESVGWGFWVSPLGGECEGRAGPAGRRPGG